MLCHWKPFRCRCEGHQPYVCIHFGTIWLEISKFREKQLKQLCWFSHQFWHETKRNETDRSLFFPQIFLRNFTVENFLRSVHLWLIITDFFFPRKTIRQKLNSKPVTVTVTTTPVAKTVGGCVLLSLQLQQHCSCLSLKKCDWGLSGSVCPKLDTWRCKFVRQLNCPLNSKFVRGPVYKRFNCQFLS